MRHLTQRIGVRSEGEAILLGFDLLEVEIGDLFQIGDLFEGAFLGSILNDCRGFLRGEFQLRCELAGGRFVNVDLRGSTGAEILHQVIEHGIELVLRALGALFDHLRDHVAPGLLSLVVCDDDVDVMTIAADLNGDVFPRTVG